MSGPRKIVVFDLNDTLLFSRREDGYILSPADAIEADGMAELLWTLRLKSVQVAVATNQPLGRFGYDEERINALMSQLGDILVRHRLGTSRIPFFVCSHDRVDDCDCRKPKPGLLERVRSEFGEAEMYMVGDKWSDVQAGHAAGAKTILVGEFGYRQKGITPMPEGVPDPDIWVPDLRTLRRIFVGIFHS